MTSHINEGIRLNKYISESGFCSRREADKLIEKGFVYINNKKAEIGSKVTSKDIVKINNEIIKPKKKRVYIAFNKPVGITCTTEKHIKGNIIDYINYPERIFHIGRLDKPSQGLIFLTNDGDIVNKILRAGNNHEKEYIVTVDKPITNEFLHKMSSGVPILDTVTKKCKVKKESKYVFKIILTQLERIRIMNVTLDNIPIGNWRYLTEEEMNTINELVESSVKTEEASKRS